MLHLIPQSATAVNRVLLNIFEDDSWKVCGLCIPPGITISPAQQTESNQTRIRAPTECF